MRWLRRWWYRMLPFRWVMEIRADLFDEKHDVLDKPRCRASDFELAVIDEALDDTRLEIERRYERMSRKKKPL